MLTHTWILSQMAGDVERRDRDIFCYNVAPDMLSIHTGITSEITHRIPRVLPLPEPYRKGAFAVFHLMVDDFAHHGRIVPEPVVDFDPDAEGYAYARGAALVPLLMALYRQNGREISLSDAAYRSHIIVEAALDLVLCLAEGPQELIDLLIESLSLVVTERIDEFSATLGWLCGIEKERVAAAIRQGHTVYTEERMKAFMSVEGRTALIMDKFDLDRHDRNIRQGLCDIMEEGMAITRDYKEFLAMVIPAVLDAGFEPALKDIRRPS